MQNIESVSPSAFSSTGSFQIQTSDPTKPVVLVVDDTPFNIDVLRGVLSSAYTLKVATNGEKALALANSHPQPELVLLDVMMPGMDGYEVCRRLKLEDRTRNIPVVFVTSMSEVEDERKGFESGGVDYITKPVSPPLVQARVATHLRLYAHERHLTELVKARTQELEQTRLEIIRRLGRAAEFKDDETGQHVIRMSHYTRILAEACGMAPDDVEVLFNAAPMHDIGKIGIPEAILLKPDKLDEEEWKVMRKHPAIGAGIIGRHAHPLLHTARIVALTHHEKWDGSGYPRGLSGEQIPLSGRIVAIADVFDALTSERPYKKAWPVEEAVALLKNNAGSHFDPTLIALFIACLPDVMKVRAMYADLPQAETLAEYAEDVAL
ncbi:MAG: two-component system response regulator [Stagnimonas sp.]|nr:two-component system response regulator [Stagnimonas sp.]